MFVVPHPPGPVLSRIGTQSRPLAVSVGGCLFITIPKCDAQRRLVKRAESVKGVFRTRYNERPIHRHMRYGRVTPTAVNST